jgi:hypothetical protein
VAGRRVDLASGAALLVFALLLWFWLIPAFGGSGEQLLLPRLVAGTVGALALVLLAGTVARRRAAAGDDPFVELGGGEPKPLVALAGVWALYCLGLDFLGFYIGALAALPASFLLLGVRRPVVIGGWTVGALLLLHLVFERGFQLRMPKGVLERLVGA